MKRVDTSAAEEISVHHDVLFIYIFRVNICVQILEWPTYIFSTVIYVN